MQIDLEALVFVILAATAIGGALGCSSRLQESS